MLRTIAAVLAAAAIAGAAGAAGTPENALPADPLRSRLLAVQVAAEQAKPEAFHRAFAELTRAMLTLLPERGEAMDLVHLYAEIDELWRHQLEAPNGAFFEEGDPLMVLMTRHSGWHEAVQSQLLRIGPRTYYPTRESRDFLVREARARLAMADAAAAH